MSLDSKVDDLSNWGPKKLRELFSKVEKRLNKLRPLPGTGIRLNETSDGVEINVDDTPQVGSNILDGAGGGSGGTNVALYGAFNGAPAIFHLKQSSPPTSPP